MSGAHAERQGVEIPIPLAAWTQIGSGAVNLRDAQGQPSISLPTAATTYRLLTAINAYNPHIVSTSAGVDRFGFKLEEIELWYSIGAVDLTANTFTLNAEVQAGAAARAAATAFGGTFTYDTDDGTLTTLGLVQRANLYKSRVILPTASQAFFITRSQLVNAEWTLATGAASGTAKVHGAIMRGRWSIMY